MADGIASRGKTGDVFLEMNGVDFRVGGQTILDHVDLEVLKGELLALVGINGAGKSSILRCMAGVWEPTSGEIRIDGLDRKTDDLAIRRFTAYLPPDPALHSLSIRENIRIFAEAYGVEPAEYRRRMDSLLRMFDLKDKQDKNALMLSKGELKKACLAAVLVSNARLYLLDEPFTGGIDPRGYDSFRRVLERLASNRDITAVFATQVLELAISLADRIAVVNYGRVLAVGTTEELREAAHLGPDVPFGEVFARLASKDSDVPVQEFLSLLEAPR
jgi:ABC-type multidrug transport system ATPase subunit